MKALFGDRTFRKELFALVLPLALQNLLQMLLSATDAIVLARCSQDAVAAVSLATEIQFVSTLIVGPLVGAVAVLAAQYWGKGDKETVQKLFAMAIRYSVGISFLFFAATTFIPDKLMMIYTSDSVMIAIGADYLRWVGVSYLLSGITQCYMFVMKLSGGASFCAYITALSVVIDVLVDICLVYGLFGFPSMGASGTAVSTVVVCVAELICVYLYSKRSGEFQFRWKELFSFSKILEQDMWKIGVPSLLSGMVWGVGFSLYSAIFGHLGSDASAAYSIAAVIQNLLFCGCRGLGVGAGILVGRALGDDRLEEAKVYGARLTKLCILFGAVTGGILILVSPLLAEFFVLSEVARGYLNQMLVVCAFYVLAKSINVTVVCGIFPAGGDVIYDAVSVVISMWLFAIPISLLGAFVFDLPVIIVYLLVCSDEIIKVPWIYPRYKKYIWLKNMTRENV